MGPSSETRIISPSLTHNHMHLKIPLRIVCSATLAIQLVLHTKQLIPELVHLAVPIAELCQQMLHLNGIEHPGFFVVVSGSQCLWVEGLCDALEAGSEVSCTSSRMAFRPWLYFQMPHDIRFFGQLHSGLHI